MTSKEQAERAADELLAIEADKRARAAERRTRPLVRAYPGLRHVPAGERKATLAEATADADGQVTVRVALALLVLAFCAFIAADLSAHSGAARFFSWAAAACFLVWQAQRQFSIRATIRQLQNTPRDR